MNGIRNRGAVVALGVLVLGAGTVARACVMEDTSNPPWPTWWWFKAPSPIPGFVRQELYMNVGLFPPAAPTPCVCGLGYSGTAIPGINALGMQVFTWDTATHTPLATVPAFSAMASNALTTAGFNNTTLYPAGAGMNWFGFGGVVPAFAPPVLPPGQQIVACFQFDIPLAWDIAFKQRLGCIAGGVGDEQFNPIFQGHPHAVGAPFACVPIIPSAGSGLVMVAAGVLAAGRRRR